MKDVLIIGQGIAGSMMAWQCLKNELKFDVYDFCQNKNCSQVANAIINPVTGKRLSTDENILKNLDLIENTYKEVSEFLGVQIYHKLSAFKIFNSNEQQNDWLCKFENNEFYKLFVSDFVKQKIADEIRTPFGACEYHPIIRVLPSLLLSSFREKLEVLDSLKPFTFSHDELKVNNSVATYKGDTYRHVVFCEGVKSRENKWFPSIPFRFAKGELLRVKMKLTFPNVIYLGPASITPTDVKDEYWIGSIYEWDPQSDNPTKHNAETLENYLKQTVNIPFEIIAHEAAIRPTTITRAPFIQTHLEYPNVHIINGLGTKGFSSSVVGTNELVKKIIK